MTRHFWHSTKKLNEIWDLPQRRLRLMKRKTQKTILAMKSEFFCDTLKHKSFWWQSSSRLYNISHSFYVFCSWHTSLESSFKRQNRATELRMANEKLENSKFFLHFVVIKLQFLAFLQLFSKPLAGYFYCKRVSSELWQVIAILSNTSKNRFSNCKGLV